MLPLTSNVERLYLLSRTAILIVPKNLRRINHKCAGSGNNEKAEDIKGYVNLLTTCLQYKRTWLD